MLDTVLCLHIHFTFHTWGNWGTKKLTYVFKVTQLEGSRIGVNPTRQRLLSQCFDISSYNILHIQRQPTNQWQNYEYFNRKMGKFYEPEIYQEKKRPDQWTFLIVQSHLNLKKAN